MMARNTILRLGCALAAGTALLGPVAAQAACRVTDFTDKPLAALSEAQRLSFISQMTQTEFTRLRAVPVGDANHHPLLASSPTLGEAQAAARARIESLGLDNTEERRRLWATDYLSDEQLRRFGDCVSSRQPGLLTLGRRENADTFHLTYAHITPIGIQKIETRLVAHYNIANVAEFEASLAALGMQDNYVARTFALKLADPSKRGMVVMRAGWETPRFVVIPAQGEPEYFK